MKLEHLIKFQNPRTCNFQQRGNGPYANVLSSKDFLNITGILQSRFPLGYSAFCGKTFLMTSDVERAVSLLSSEGIKVACGYPVMSKLSESERRKVVSVIAQYAFSDWSRSAQTQTKCHVCNGSGMHSGKACVKCQGKGFTRASCKDCRGRGVSIDRQKTALQGVPVYKNCKRCDGRGYSRIPATVVYRALTQITDKISRDVWNKCLKNLYFSLITRLDEEEAWAEKQLNRLIK
ncbi:MULTISPECIES: antitermination protein [unclassified Pantoea]|uniref:antitermination protein Q n=1 Tax=unclassified Pantoea TaxID=2630326 RepID=UPI001CD5BEB7|nr:MULTISPECIES: antitermination protein [unclassified Pantoea]MCA1179804.1 hypothetical protein [Pantoea sp. alder69]MCA1253594.1 hypothetical protein [Pantoea sp. alder70]MCA1268290.1 hypothetical protein [Pantoea sp. alder81]